MKQQKISKKVIKLIICICVVAVFVGIAYFADLFDSVENTFKTDMHITFTNIIMVVIMGAGVMAVKYLLDTALSLAKPRTHRGSTLVSIISSIFRYVAVMLILCWGLAILGVNVSTIIASVGVLALIIGFGAESLIEDVITGLFMLLENQYNVGDIVEVSGFRGVVSNISIRTTAITDISGNIKIINNSDMKNILNRSSIISKAASEIAIPYATDLEKLESEIPALMKEIYEKNSDVMKSEPVYLGVQALADSAIVLKFVVDVSESDIYKGPRLLNHDLLLGFRKLGIECPFTQVDVHNK
ncbi:MAG: mechanosensitive ion channel family protein [Lachnospiraceae bacterium]|nr:mechanosensitive ion channel family protein [Lachnospiraceae bacterium]